MGGKLNSVMCGKLNSIMSGKLNPTMGGKHNPTIDTAIRLKKTRTEKKDANKQIWLELKETPQYRNGLKERYKIERKFGEAKQGHGLGRCRYVGLLGFAVQVFMMAIMLDLKRMVKLLTEVGFITKAVSA